MSNSAKWGEIFARMAIASTGLLLVVVAEYPPYVEWMKLRWWESWGQIFGGCAMALFAFMPGWHDGEDCDCNYFRDLDSSGTENGGTDEARSSTQGR